MFVPHGICLYGNVTCVEVCVCVGVVPEQGVKSEPYSTHLNLNITVQYWMSKFINKSLLQNINRRSLGTERVKRTPISVAVVEPSQPRPSSAYFGFQETLAMPWKARFRLRLSAQVELRYWLSSSCSSFWNRQIAMRTPKSYSAS